VPEVVPEVLVFPGEEAAEDIVGVGSVGFEVGLRVSERDCRREYGVVDRRGGCDELWPEVRCRDTRERL
jgi:hypothetical protein